MTWRLAASVHRGRRGGRRPIEEALGSRSEDRGRGRGWTGRRKGTRAYKQKKGTTFLFLTMRVWGGFDEVRTRLRNQALLFFWFEEAKHFFHFFFSEIISTFFCAKHIVLPLSYFFVCRESSSYKLGTFEVLQDCSGFGLAPFQSLGKVAVSTCFFFFAKTPRFPKRATHTRTRSVKEVRKRRAGFDVYLFLWGSNPYNVPARVAYNCAFTSHPQSPRYTSPRRT